MDTINIFDVFFGQSLVVGMAMLRIAVAYMILPIFSSQLIPATVRNALFVALAIVVIVVQPAIDVQDFNAQDWLVLFVKEMLLGIGLGVFFGVHLWAFEAAGQIIDVQIGAGTAQIFDPIGGHQTTLIGAFLGRLANYIFMAAGGLMFLTGAVMESYALWPIDSPMPNLSWASIRLFEQEFSDFFTLALLISAPVLVMAFLVDVSMGLVNRYAQQFNVFFLSMSIKMFGVIFVLIVSMGFLVDKLIYEITEHSSQVIALMLRVFGQ